MITLYSTGCPKCQVLEKKLNKDGIEFTISNDIDSLIEKGFMSAPVLRVDDEYLEFKDAVNWLKNRGKQNED
jgi:glutaredoxin